MKRIIHLFLPFIVAEIQDERKRRAAYRAYSGPLEVIASDSIISRLLPENNERAWKANLLVPVRSSRELSGSFSLIRNLVYPKGSIKLVGMSGLNNETDLRDSLMDLAMSFSKENVYTRWTAIDTDNFKEAVLNSLQTLQGTFSGPISFFFGCPTTVDMTKRSTIS